MSGSAAPTNMDSEDLIEDDYDSYDELFTQHFTEDRDLQLDDVRYRLPSQNGVRTCPRGRPSKIEQKPDHTTKRFFWQTQSSSEPEVQAIQSSTKFLPWAQKYAPRNLDELAVHKRKVRDVEQWLNDALTGRSQRRLLVLKGPAGCGKTATISVLSEKLNYGILEWRSPLAAEYSSKDFISLGARFDGFLGRGHKFDSLDLDGCDSTQMSLEDRILTSRRRIIVIEEFPMMSGHTASVLAAFRLSILRYISENISSDRADSAGNSRIPPIVMIVTESFSTSGSSIDSLTAQRLLGHEIYMHPSTSVIEFNSVAPTFMSKALNLVLKKSTLQPFGSQSSAQTIIGSMSEGGDIRNAIATLEFICLGSGNQGPQSKTSASKPRHATRGRKKMSPVSSETPRFFEPRSATLSLFHAVGKIVYNKRDHGPERAPLQSASFSDQPGVSLVNVNGLPDETGADIQSFVSTLHENYVPSCYGPTFTECLDGCIESLSDSDMLSFERRIHYRRAHAGLRIGIPRTEASVDLLRQEELSYQVAARGLLFALPWPVQRQISGADDTKLLKNTYKLSFPPSAHLVRRYEEIQGLISSWGNILLGPNNRLLGVPASDHFVRKSFHEEESDPDTILMSVATLTSRNDLILHQLPYMTLILGEEAVGLRRLGETSSLGAQKLDYSWQQGERHYLNLSAQEHNVPYLREPKGADTVLRVRLPQPRDQQDEDAALILSDDDIIDDL